MKRCMLVAGCVLASAGFVVAQEKAQQDETVLANGTWMRASEVVTPLQVNKSPFMEGEFVGENGNDLIIEMPAADEIIPPAAQICIDFDNLGAPCTFNLTTALRNEYAGVGVLFDGPAALDGGGAIDECGNFGVSARSGTAFMAFNAGCTSCYSDGGTPRDPQTILFPGGASLVSMWLSGGSNSNSIDVQAFDSGGGLIDSTTVNAPGAAYTEAVVMGSGIARVVVTDNGDGVFVMDDLCYDEDVQQSDCIDFDDLGAPCTFSETAALRNEYAALGVNFDGPGRFDGGGVLDQCGGFGVNARSGTAFLAFNRGATYPDGGTATDPETILWDYTVSSVSIWVSGGSSGTTFRMQAFDGGGNNVGNGSASSPPGGYAELRVDAAGIRTVEITETGGDSAFVMDDLCWSAGPGPCLTLTNTGYIGGQPVTWMISGGTPGQKGVVVYGFNPKDPPLLLNDYQTGNTLWCCAVGIAGVNESKIVGNPKTLDANGEASWTKTMPLNQVGNTILTQALGSNISGMRCNDDLRCQSDVDATTVQ